MIKNFFLIIFALSAGSSAFSETCDISNWKPTFISPWDNPSGLERFWKTIPPFREDDKICWSFQSSGDWRSLNPGPECDYRENHLKSKALNDIANDVSVYVYLSESTPSAVPDKWTAHPRSERKGHVICEIRMESFSMYGFFDIPLMTESSYVIDAKDLSSGFSKNCSGCLTTPEGTEICTSCEPCKTTLGNLEKCSWSR